MIELAKHIEILLLDNDCVIVPEFGGFMAHHVNSVYDEEDGLFLLSELKVTTGISNNLDTAISGPGVKAGLRVLNNPQNYLSLLGRAIPISERAAGDPMSLMMQGGF